MFLFNIARFAEWPEATLPDQAPLLLCVLGPNSLLGTLATLVKQRSIRGHPVRTLALADPSDASTCHLIFISANMSEKIAETLEALPRTGLLTVGDFDGFAEAGGAIEFTKRNESVAFKINLRVALSAQVQLSAQLIELAIDVQD